MAYVPTTFIDRSVEFPNRRTLTAVSGQSDTFDVTRAEGTVFAEGTKPDAANLNAEFGKIKTETDAINTSLQNLTRQETVLASNISATGSVTLADKISNYNMVVVRLRSLGTHGSSNGGATSESFFLTSTLLENLDINYFYCTLNNNPAYYKYCAFTVSSDTTINVKEFSGGTWGTLYVDIIGIK